LTDQVNLANGDNAGGEELQDHGCAIGRSSEPGNALLQPRGQLSALPRRWRACRRRSGIYPEPTFGLGAICWVLTTLVPLLIKKRSAVSSQAEKLSSPSLVATKARPQMTEVSVARTAS
jgi:hypothetical protein